MMKSTKNTEFGVSMIRNPRDLRALVVKTVFIFLGRCYLLNDFSHNKMTGLAMKIVE